MNRDNSKFLFTFFLTKMTKYHVIILFINPYFCGKSCDEVLLEIKAKLKYCHSVYNLTCFIFRRR